MKTQYGYDAATYSTFVPDDTGVMERMRQNREEFSRVEDTYGKTLLRRRGDECERRLNPLLEHTYAMAKSLGLVPPHPEANYHISDGRTIFFEIEEVHVKNVLARLLDGSQDLDALVCFAALYGIAVKMWSWENRERPESYPSQKSVGDLINDTFGVLIKGDAELVKFHFDVANLLYMEFGHVEEVIRTVRRQRMVSGVRDKISSFLQDEVAPEIWQFGWFRPTLPHIP